jgi:hypothetical protein
MPASQLRAGPERPLMESRITPDRDSVANALTDIDSSPEEIKDEMLTELLVRTYPLRVSQDN